MRKGRVRRRDFLKGAAGSLAVAAALPTIIPATALGRNGKKPPSERIVLGMIGTGDLGRRHHLGGTLLKHEDIQGRVDVAAVCDVDRNYVDEAARVCMERTGKRVAIYHDFRKLLERKDLDAVFIVTPDHWHAIPAIAAMEAGLDVYCEKPLSLTVEEGKAMVAAARRYGTVFQVGSQQRSNDGFHRACELVRNGKIGKIKRIDTVLHSVSEGEWKPARTPPPELDWNFWLGQAPYRDYHPNLVHYLFRWQFDYSGGVMTDWGAHHNDIAQWALNMDESGPVYVDGTRAEFGDEGPRDVALNFDVHYKYANGVDLYCHTDKQEYDDGTRFGNGVKFTGDNGWIFVSRGDIKASDPDLLKIELGPGDVRLYKSDNHHLNFLDCVQSRERCICDVEIGHRSVSVCHIGNISMRLGRPLKWDPEKQQFVGDDEANAMLSRTMRAPWRL
ncbi:MAG TPA: Gfo/Idh/MocA family oxidoreductase [Phycisphaerae bacterium]|nr:Gfo/Idh/MocA family oxidoreductase [Phycisphaerae bacterium]